VKIVVGKGKILGQLKMKQYWKINLLVFFPIKFLWKKKPLTKMMEQNRSLQTQSNIINIDEEMMKLNLYV
jgi:hypothetical protein